MSTQTTTRKRKTGGDISSATKKIKTTKAANKTTKSADKPAPLRSALKKSTDGDNVIKTIVKPPRTVLSKTTKKAPKVQKADEAAVVTSVGDIENDGVELTEDQTAALLAGFSSSEDEGDGDDDEDGGVPLSKIPRVPSAPSTGLIQKRIRLAVAEQDDPETTPGVIYIGRIPHGFYEHQLRAYLTQFGEILNLRLARNKKTGRSQHYGFVEFASAAVADIVVKTMDKYLLFGHILQVKRVPREQVKEGIFNGSGRRRKPAPRNRMEGGYLRRGMVREDWEKRIERENTKRAERAAKLKELGYDFEMPALKAVSDVPVKPKPVIEVGEDTGKNDSVESLKVAQAEVPMVEEVVQTVQSEPNRVTVTEEKTRKRLSIDSKTKRQTKKVKT